MQSIVRIIALVLVLTTIFSFVGCRKKEETGNTDDLRGSYNITVWVSESVGAAELVKAQIDRFEEANPGIVINAVVEGVNGGDVASKIVNDVATAPDLYTFSQDQLARLVQAAALAPLGERAGEKVSSANDAGAVKAARMGDQLYAYPLTSDNGYYMYYDKSIISEDEAEDMTAIIAACERNKRYFRFALEDGWYTASFFFATGCHSMWEMDAEGKFVSVDDDFNSEAGLVSMKGMMELAKSPYYSNNAEIFTNAGAIITGTWNSAKAESYFGANMGVTDLPSFTVDGKSYHLGSYTGNKLLGVKPQTDGKRQAVLSLLAEFLTGETCQSENFEKMGWGPSNKAVQTTDAVQADPHLSALAKQGEYGEPQGQVPGSWWDIAKVLGAEAKAAKSEEDLKTALKEYEAALKASLGSAVG